jgi:hypothetical protein
MVGRVASMRGRALWDSMVFSSWEKDRPAAFGPIRRI